jgi:hypothetical protein
MIPMNAVSFVRLAVLLDFALGPSLLAQQASGPDDPAVKKYLKDCDDAVAKFEQGHATEVELIKARLKKVHQGIYQYLLKHRGIWPQAPSGLNNDGRMKWWAETLRDYGITESDLNARPRMILGNFDSEPLTAYRWKGQPWIMMEIGQSGWPAYMIVADGTVKGDAMMLVERPKTLGMPFSLDMGSKPAEIPEELKKAAQTKPEH